MPPRLTWRSWRHAWKTRFAQMDARFEQMETRMDARFAQMENRLLLKFGGLVIATVGVAVAVLRLLG